MVKQHLVLDIFVDGQYLITEQVRFDDNWEAKTEPDQQVKLSHNLRSERLVFFDGLRELLVAFAEYLSLQGVGLIKEIKLIFWHFAAD